MDRRHWIALVLATAAGSAAAQGYPNKSSSCRCPLHRRHHRHHCPRDRRPAGPALGQSVIVENKGGGGGIVGANETPSRPRTATRWALPRSPPRRQPAINPKTPYNPLTDFTPIINIAATPNIIAVHPAFRPRTTRLCG